MVNCSFEQFHLFWFLLCLACLWGSLLFSFCVCVCGCLFLAGWYSYLRRSIASMKCLWIREWKPEADPPWRGVMLPCSGQPCAKGSDPAVLSGCESSQAEQTVRLTLVSAFRSCPKVLLVAWLQHQPSGLLIWVLVLKTLQGRSIPMNT